MATPPGRRSARPRGRPGRRCPKLPPPPNQKACSGMTTREKELAGLSPGSDPPQRLPGLLERVVEPFRRGAAPESRQATGFYTDTSVCIGCKACEVACKQWNQ